MLCKKGPTRTFFLLKIVILFATENDAQIFLVESEKLRKSRNNEFKLKLKENKRPKKQDYYKDGKLNEDKYNEAIKSWKEKTGNRQGDQMAKVQM